MVIFKIGTKVEIYDTGSGINDSIKATIRSICIRSGFNEKNISYKCVWWNNNKKYEEWLDEFEFRVINGEKNKRIGFK